VKEIIFRKGLEPWRYILEEAIKNKVNLIIMGRREKQDLRKL
jgi:nucleotide-binding universal stress UspA family protein